MELGTGTAIPGKPRVFMPYAFGLNYYRDHCASVAKNCYEGFIMTKVSKKPLQDEQNNKIIRVKLKHTKMIVCASNVGCILANRLNSWDKQRVGVVEAGRKKER